MPRTTLFRATIGAALVVALLTGCSDDDPGGTGETSNPTPDGAGASILDDLPIDGVIAGLEAAMGDVDIDVDGDTLHVHVADGNSSVPQGTGCMIVGSVLPDGFTAVVHQGGTSTTCD